VSRTLLIEDQNQKGNMKQLGNRYLVTGSVTLLAVFGFAFFVPSNVAFFDTLSPAFKFVLYPVKLIAGSFLHVHPYHLIMNVVLWGFAGVFLEPKVGSRRLLGVAILATLIGGLLETLLVDPNFIGLSAACYGLIGVIIWYAIARGKGKKGMINALIAGSVLMAADTVFNSIASPDNIAYAAHIGGFMAGLFSSLGFGKGSQESEPIFRPMTERDIKPVLDIIYDHDEDDGEEAEDAFNETMDGKYVVEYDGFIIGMTGYKMDPHTAHTAWLSFTYIHRLYRKNGNAHWMMLELREILDQAGIERLFIATSDYLDEETGEDIYLAARNFYEKRLNAERQLKVDNFYAPGESKYIYSLAVNDRARAEVPPNENAVARFVGLELADESETSYVACWEEMADASAPPETRLPTKSLADLVEEAVTYDGKSLFVTLPNYISDQHEKELKAAGFTELGILRDYFSKDVHEVYWGMFFG